MLKADESRIMNHELRGSPHSLPLSAEGGSQPKADQPPAGAKASGGKIRGVGGVMNLVTLSIIISLFWHQKVLAPSAPSPPAPRSEVGEIGGDKEGVQTILAVGDILLSRNVGAKIDQANDPTLPFQNLQELLVSADIAFGNLECPLSDSPIPIREGLVFRCLTKYVPGLTFAGFDILSTANNHALDQGTKYVGFTRDYLFSQNILPVGTGENQDEAWTPAIISPHPTLSSQRRGGGGEEPKIAFLAVSYASHNDGGKSRNDYVARIEDIEILKSKILNLKSSDYFVVVSMHAGTEYTRNPNQEQINFAHAAIDAGADIVIGHHPHWIQPVEVIKRKAPAPYRTEGSGTGVIFYSLGNFIFDQSWSQETKEGLVVKLNIKYQKSNIHLESAELIPVIIENNCCPRIATEEEKERILKKINLETDTLFFP